MVDYFFLIAVTPLCLLAAYTDLRWMIIHNEVSIALLLIFVLVGQAFLPLETIGLRLLAAFLVLAVGFVLNAIGQIGGGDVKFLAAFTPFIGLFHAADFLMIFSVCLIVTLILHRLAKRIPAIRAATPDWKSWEAGRHFPMGVSISAAAILFLGLMVLRS